VSIVDHVTDFAIRNSVEQQQAVDMDGILIRSLVTIGTAVNLSNIPNSNLTTLTPNLAVEVNIMICRNFELHV